MPGCARSRPRKVRNGIRANVVVPGSINTPAWAHRLEQNPENHRSDQDGSTHLAVWWNQLEVARTVAFLASPLASGITGAAIPVDAGISAGNLPFLDQIAGG